MTLRLDIFEAQSESYEYIDSSDYNLHLETSRAFVAWQKTISWRGLASKPSHCPKMRENQSLPILRQTAPPSVTMFKTITVVNEQ